MSSGLRVVMALDKEPHRRLNPQVPQCLLRPLGKCFRKKPEVMFKGLKNPLGFARAVSVASVALYGP